MIAKVLRIPFAITKPNDAIGSAVADALKEAGLADNLVTSFDVMEDSGFERFKLAQSTKTTGSLFFDRGNSDDIQVLESIRDTGLTSKFTHGGSQGAGKLEWRPGAYVLVGRTGTGKTTFAGQVARELGATFVRVTEPQDYDKGEPVIESLSFVESSEDQLKICRAFSIVDVAERLVEAFIAKDQTIVIDSLQSLLFAGGGEAAQAGGLSPAFFTMMSELSSIASLTGTVVLVAINPLIPDNAKGADLVAALAEAMPGSAAGFLYKSAPEQLDYSFRHVADRATMNMRLVRGEDPSDPVPTAGNAASVQLYRDPGKSIFGDITSLNQPE